MCKSSGDAGDREVIGVLFHLVVGLCAEMAQSDPDRVERIRDLIGAVPTERLSLDERGELEMALRLLDRLDRSVSVAH